MKVSLLTFVSLVCILISLFGIFSLVTLSCEQRRKEIAIRRVNRAQVYHILSSIFFREYLLLLATSYNSFSCRIRFNETMD